MSVLSRHPESPFVAVDWQPEVIQLLDNDHLAAWSDVPRRRTHFAASLQQFIGSQRDTEVCVFHGRFIRDLDSFCHQLERVIPGPPLERRIHGPRGITAMLRSRQSFRGRPVARFRYTVWNDAHVLLEHDPVLFGELVDAIVGVAAEAEYASEDLLMIHRTVFIGSTALEAYSADASGQFRSWKPDAMSSDALPFWEEVSGLPQPPIERYAIDELMSG